MSPQAERPTLGLRERKKAKTRAAIQQHALDLFRAQGYASTTIEQIADAAEVSQSTFFRYFPTKEDVVLSDDFDPLIAATFRAQHAGLGAAAALRCAMRSLSEAMSPDELAVIRDRSAIVFAVPELWGTALVQLAEGTDLIAELIGERLGRDPREVPVRAFAGAVTGVMISLLRTWAEDPDGDILAAMDEAMAFLEAGLPLEQGGGDGSAPRA